MSLYPTRQPITTANIEAALAECLARRFPDGEASRTAFVKLNVTKFHPAARAAIVARMAEAMRMFGEGMTEDDLKRAEFTADEIKHCAKDARDLAMAHSRLN